MADIRYEIWRTQQDGWVNPTQSFGVAGLAQPGAPLIHAIKMVLVDVPDVQVFYQVRMNGNGAWDQGFLSDGNPAGAELPNVKIDLVKIHTSRPDIWQVIYQVYSPFGAGWVGAGINGTAVGKPRHWISAIRITLLPP